MFKNRFFHKGLFMVIALVLCGLLLGWANPVPAGAAENLKLATSAQAFAALQNGGLKQFTEQTGVTVEVDVVSSGAALDRLTNGLCDAAIVAGELTRDDAVKGYTEIPFCKDAIAIITSATPKTESLTLNQVRAIFSKRVTNWKEVGGPDLPILVIVPGKHTALFQHFTCIFMAGRDVAYDVLTYRSTFCTDITRRCKGSISFVNLGATFGRPEGASIIKVDGLGPGDEGYPYMESFSLVTRGGPSGPAKQFAEYLHSDGFIRILKSKSMIPFKE